MLNLLICCTVSIVFRLCLKQYNRTNIFTAVFCPWTASNSSFLLNDTADIKTSSCDFLLYTITGNFTMFSAFNCLASTNEIILLPFFGVAVRSSTNDGLKFCNISLLSLLVAWWLSSTITTGFSLRITWIKAVSSVSSNKLLLSCLNLTNGNKLPFPDMLFFRLFYLS